MGREATLVPKYLMTFIYVSNNFNKLFDNDITQGQGANISKSFPFNNKKTPTKKAFMLPKKIIKLTKEKYQNQTIK